MKSERRWTIAAAVTWTFLACCGLLWGGEIEGPDQIGTDELGRLSIKLGEGDTAAWDAVGIKNGGFIEADGEAVDGGSRYLFTGAPGRYRVTVMYLEDGHPGIARKVILIGDPKPDDVVPDEDPKPDDVVPVPPKPDVDPILIGEGYRVMILHETSDVLSPEQQAVLTSVKLKNYLDNVTARDGSTPAYRVWTDDYEADDLDHVEEVWRKSYPKVKEAAKTLPWVVATNGAKQVSAPLPATVDETIALLKTVE